LTGSKQQGRTPKPSEFRGWVKQVGGGGERDQIRWRLVFPGWIKDRGGGREDRGTEEATYMLSWGEIGEKWYCRVNWIFKRGNVRPQKKIMYQVDVANPKAGKPETPNFRPRERKENEHEGRGG